MIVTSGECCLAGACNCQSCMNETTNEDLPQRRLVQTSDNRTQSAVYLSGHVTVDRSNQLDTAEDCKPSYSACDTAVQDESGQQQHVFKCEVCNIKFAKASSLTTHMYTHTWVRCKVCDKKFTRFCELQSHMRIHTGEKPFSCKVCDKKFRQLGHLSTHMTVHTGEKPFCCEVCDKKFTQLGNLRTHIRLHMGEKPFSCKVCDKKFTTSHHLT